MKYNTRVERFYKERKLLLGMDIRTTSVKAILFSIKGRTPMYSQILFLHPFSKTTSNSISSISTKGEL